MKKFTNRLVAHALILFLGISILAGCGLSLNEPPARPTTAIQDVSYQKLIQPAFSKDFADKRVRFNAVYFGLMEMVMDLPGEYKDHIRIQLCSASEMTKLGNVLAPTCENMYSNVVIAKGKSDPVFDMKQGQKIKVVAYAVSTTSRSAISGRGQNKLLLVLESLESFQPVTQ